MTFHFAHALRTFGNEAMLTDGEIILRPYRRDDRSTLAKLADNAKISRYMSGRFPTPYTLDAADQWINKVELEQEILNFAIQWRGEHVGGIGLEPLKDVFCLTTGLGYWLGETFWGNGLATRAVALMVDYAFSELHFLRIQGLVYEGNERSAKVLQKNGFEKEGTLRQYVNKDGHVFDSDIYSRVC
jgi:RimJ/RimL family protein N-acetyltransferase